MTVGLGSGLGCMPTLSVMKVPIRSHMYQLWCYIKEPYLFTSIQAETYEC